MKYKYSIKLNICGIWGSHGGDNVESIFLEHHAASNGK
jgi:hypothetical protein